MTPEEQFDISAKKIEQNALGEVSREINEIVKYLASHKEFDFTADQISRAMNKLAVLRAGLGEIASDAGILYDMTYGDRKFKRAGEWIAQKEESNKMINKLTNPDIEAIVEQKIRENVIDELEKKHFAERLKILFDSTALIVSTLQSRLSYLKSEKQETAYYNK